ncbi:MAG: nucleotide exchange factor GrpE [Acidimicrobiales bacterium]|nr:nucleotide exchange factor GrpE [Acidimicrobiales bacterium]
MPAGPENDAISEEPISEEPILEGDRPAEGTEQTAGQEAGAAGEAADPAERLAAMAAQRDEYLDALRRLQADFENYRKRVLRQQTDLLERAAFDLVGKLLPILDTIDLALAHAQGDPPSDGLSQVASTARDALSREGLERLDPTGQPFDPAIHEAVAHEEASEESDKPQVSEVLRPGYRWKGQLLRPAMVKVTG